VLDVGFLLLLLDVGHVVVDVVDGLRQVLDAVDALGEVLYVVDGLWEVLEVVDGLVEVGADEFLQLFAGLEVVLGLFDGTGLVLVVDVKEYLDSADAVAEARVATNVFQTLANAFAVELDFFVALKVSNSDGFAQEIHAVANSLEMASNQAHDDSEEQVSFFLSRGIRARAPS